MKKFLNILSVFFILTQSAYAQNFKIEKILDLKDPWSLTFINKDEVLITEPILLLYRYLLCVKITS